jgi:hypothetical protein
MTPARREQRPAPGGGLVRPGPAFPLVPFAGW